MMGSSNRGEKVNCFSSADDVYAGCMVVFAVDNSRRMMGLRGRSLPMWTTHFAEPAVHTIKRNDSAHVPAGTSWRSESER